MQDDFFQRRVCASALLPQVFPAGAVPTPGGNDVALSHHIPQQAQNYFPCKSKECDKGEHDKDHDHDGDWDHDGDDDHDHGDGDGDDTTTVTVTDWYATHKLYQ